MEEKKKEIGEPRIPLGSDLSLQGKMYLYILHIKTKSKITSMLNRSHSGREIVCKQTRV